MFFTGEAQVFNFSWFRIAGVAKVFKIDKDFEIIWNYAAFVLPDIFWTQFEFTSLNVIARLNECCVEHDPAESAVTEASVFQKYLNVSV